MADAILQFVVESRLAEGERLPAVARLAEDLSVSPAVVREALHDLPVLCVVMNDSGLGNVRQFQGDRVVAANFEPTDHTAIARGFGARGVRVEDSRDLASAIQDAQASGQTTVIDVVIDQEPSPGVYCGT